MSKQECTWVKLALTTGSGIETLKEVKSKEVRFKEMEISVLCALLKYMCNIDTAVKGIFFFLDLFWVVLLCCLYTI